MIDLLSACFLFFPFFFGFLCFFFLPLWVSWGSGFWILGFRIMVSEILGFRISRVLQFSSHIFFFLSFFPPPVTSLYASLWGFFSGLTPWNSFRSTIKTWKAYDLRSLLSSIFFTCLVPLLDMQFVGNVWNWVLDLEHWKNSMGVCFLAQEEWVSSFCFPILFSDVARNHPP